MKNATVKEFEESRVMRGRCLYAMHVENHMTAVEGVAKVMMDSVDHGKVLQYMETVRGVQLGKNKCDLLFVLCGGKCLGSFSSKLVCGSQVWPKPPKCYKGAQDRGYICCASPRPISTS